MGSSLLSDPLDKIINNHKKWLSCLYGVIFMQLTNKKSIRSKNSNKNFIQKMFAYGLNHFLFTEKSIQFYPSAVCMGVQRDDPLPPSIDVTIKLKQHCSFCNSKLGVATLPVNSILVK